MTITTVTTIQGIGFISAFVAIVFSCLGIYKKEWVTALCSWIIAIVLIIFSFEGIFDVKITTVETDPVCEIITGQDAIG